MHYFSRRSLCATGFCIAVTFSSPSHALLEECPETTDTSPKKILIFTDGTGNTRSDQTNVRRLFDMVVAQKNRNIVAYYDRGVGNFGKKILGGAIGSGLAKNVRQAYRCLAEHYRPDDQIYIFGFSRGAYTARVLGGMIHLLGVLNFPDGMSKSAQRHLVEDLYEVYRNNRDDGFEKQKQQFQSKHPTQTVSIDVMGVWDTVAALGLISVKKELHEKCLESGFLSWLGSFFGKDEDSCLLQRAASTLYQDFHWVGPEGIRKVLHAVSIDERRRAFKIELYDSADFAPDQTLKQVWFAGVHSDVGGGYDSDKLSSISLNWMIQNLREDDILPANTRVQGQFDGPMHTSYKGFYKKVAPVTREIKFGSTIHRSVVRRLSSPLPQPNKDRESEGVYLPIQFKQCLQGQAATLVLLEDCYKVVGE